MRECQGEDEMRKTNVNRHARAWKPLDACILDGFEDDGP
jgi:hypothetical protein